MQAAVRKNAARILLLLASFPLLYYGGVHGVGWCAVAGTALTLCSAAACMRGGPTRPPDHTRRNDLP